MLSALKRTAAKRAPLSDEAHCALCGQRMTLRLLQRHVARHQEQLALFALPPNLEATEDDPQDEERPVDVREWQDEELSDVSDTLDATDSVGEEPAPVGRSSPQTLQNSIQELDAIALNFHNNLAPECEEFVHSPPREQAECDYLHKKLSEMILREALLKLDHVETFDDSYIRLRRKELVRKAQRLLNRLDKVLPANPKEGGDVEEAGATGGEPSPISRDHYDAHLLTRSGADAESNPVTPFQYSMAPETYKDEDTWPLSKSILRKPTEKFPENPEPIREGVAPHKSAMKGKEIPPEARWTKIDRKLVNPEALEAAKERFEERLDCVIVLRVLTHEEIQKLADQTKEIRESRGELTQVSAPLCSADNFQKPRRKIRKRPRQGVSRLQLVSKVTQTARLHIHIRILGACTVTLSRCGDGQRNKTL